MAIEYGCEGHPSPYGAEWSTQKIPMVIVFVMKVAISWAKDECFLRLPSICPICIHMSNSAESDQRRLSNDTSEGLAFNPHCGNRSNY